MVERWSDSTRENDEMSVGQFSEEVNCEPLHIPMGDREVRAARRSVECVIDRMNVTVP